MSLRILSRDEAPQPPEFEITNLRLSIQPCIDVMNDENAATVDLAKVQAEFPGQLGYQLSTNN